MTLILVLLIVPLMIQMSLLYVVFVQRFLQQFILIVMQVRDLILLFLPLLKVITPHSLSIDNWLCGNITRTLLLQQVDSCD